MTPGITARSVAAHTRPARIRPLTSDEQSRDGLQDLLDGPPDTEIRALACSLTMACLGRTAELTRLYRFALSRGLSPDALREGALMVPLFAGYPRAIEAFSALHAALPAAARGRKAPTPPRRTPSELRSRGNSLFRKIYGRHAREVRKRLVRFHPELERAIIEHAYGGVLSRGGLSPRARELMAVCALAASDLPLQLGSHVRGALRCGASPPEVRAMVDLAGRVAGERLVARARAELDRAIRVDRTERGASSEGAEKPDIG